MQRPKYQLFNAGVISHIDDEHKVACALIFSTKLIFEVFYTGGLGAIGAIVGRKSGKRKFIQCGKILRNGQLLGLCYVLPAAAAALSLEHILQLPLVAQPEDATKITGSYFKIFIFAFPAIALYSANEQFGFAINKVAPAVIAKSIGHATLFGSAYFLVPEMGASGLAVSYVIQSWTNLIILEAMQFGRVYSRYGVFESKSFIPDLSCIRKIVKVGFPGA